MNNSSELSKKRLIYVVEPHPIALRHLLVALRRDPALEVVPSGLELSSDDASRLKLFVLIVDADAIPVPFVPYLRTMRTLSQNSQIVVIGKGVSDDGLCQLLFYGARGYVSYEKIDAEISQAVECVFKGGVWATPTVLQRFVRVSSNFASRSRREGWGLSPRESEIVGLLQRRLSNKEIGCALGISERTVRFHLESIFNKIGVRDRYSVIELLRATGFAGPQNAEETDQSAHERKLAGPQVL